MADTATTRNVHIFEGRGGIGCNRNFISKNIREIALGTVFVITRKKVLLPRNSVFFPEELVSQLGTKRHETEFRKIMKCQMPNL
jgi:hypothetical protein